MLSLIIERFGLKKLKADGLPSLSLSSIVYCLLVYRLAFLIFNFFPDFAFQFIRKFRIVFQHISYRITPLA